MLIFNWDLIWDLIRGLKKFGFSWDPVHPFYYFYILFHLFLYIFNFFHDIFASNHLTPQQHFLKVWRTGGLTNRHTGVRSRDKKLWLWVFAHFFNQIDIPDVKIYLLGLQTKIQRLWVSFWAFGWWWSSEWRIPKPDNRERGRLYKMFPQSPKWLLRTYVARFWILFPLNLLVSNCGSCAVSGSGGA